MSRVVLAVDDKQLVLDITAEMLEDLGCEVVTAPECKRGFGEPLYRQPDRSSSNRHQYAGYERMRTRRAGGSNLQ
jgi:hypothetical protein